MQDAFLRCLEKAPDFESPAHARAWLLRVTVNGCKSRLRAPGGGAPPLCWTPIPPPRREEGALLEAMQALPARDRAVLHLYYYEGLPDCGDRRPHRPAGGLGALPPHPRPDQTAPSAERRRRMKHYRSYMDRITAPARLRQRVLEAAEQGRAPAGPPGG